MSYKNIFNRKLGDFLNLQFGLHQKKKNEGEVKYFTTSHFDADYKPTKFKESFIDLQSKDKKFLLQPNDVILVGKGQRIFAWAYEPIYGDVVPSSVFYILRMNPREVNGRYLAAVLNTSQKQYELNLIGSGTSLTSITKKELLNLEVTIPSIEKQNKIVKAIKLLEEDIVITAQILENKRVRKQGLLNELLTLKEK